MTHLLKLIIIGFIFTLTSCGHTSKPDLQELIKLEQIISQTPKNNYNVDITFKIVNEIKTDSTHIYVAKGLYKDKNVGLQVEVKSDIPKGITFQGNYDHEIKKAINGVKIMSIGLESDNFIETLGELYGLPTKRPFSKKTILANAYLFKQKLADLDKKDKYRFDIIFEENNESLFSELFLIINTTDRIIELDEKDIAYRQQILSILTE
jgi:hypothetical protein